MKNIVEKKRFGARYFQYISNFKSPITYIFVKSGCSNYFFLNSANLICRGTDISKHFIESLGIRDNESRLYCSQKQRTHKRKKIEVSVSMRPACALFVCVEVLRPSQTNGVRSSAVSLPNHTFTGQA